MKALLSFEQAPPFDVPVRFLLTAVPFGIAAGVLLMFSGDALASRWSDKALALTHLQTAGFMLQAMSGALLQLTPVAIGANVWRPRLLAGLAHPTLLIGAIGLSAAFLSPQAWLFTVGSLMLGLGVVLLSAFVLVALARHAARNQSHHALRIALLCLLVTAALGMWLALARAGIAAAPPDALSTTSHLRFGWLGWALVLLAGAGYMVVPMFQLTPPYPASFQRLFAPVVLVGLVVCLLLPDAVGNLLLAALAAVFAAMTLWLQTRRRRPRVDTSFRFWQLAMASTLLAALLAAALPLIADSERAQVLLGIVVLLGGFSSVIAAMMYKIVPFLVWLHLNNAGADALLMHQVVEEKRMKWHLRLHVAATLCALPIPWIPLCSVPAGALLALAQIVLGANLLSACLRFRERMAACAGSEC